ncbi:MAG TPA: hypothetical protein VM639_24410 [Dongiaceae bacterium]|nr:hypothetical protein [Dongiaceae bacterium]
MTGLVLPRRQLLRMAAGLIVAPSIVRASSIMHVRPIVEPLVTIKRAEDQFGGHHWFVLIGQNCPSDVIERARFNRLDGTAHFEAMERGDLRLAEKMVAEAIRAEWDASTVIA